MAAALLTFAYYYYRSKKEFGGITAVSYTHLGLTGMCIGGALWHIPIVLDGVISMAAALVAERLFPGVREYLIPSHQGKEPAAVKLADALQLSPVIHAGMALGEGTGAVMMFTLLDMAMSIYGPVSYTHLDVYKRQLLST